MKIGIDSPPTTCASFRRMGTNTQAFIFAIDPGLNGAWAALGRDGEFLQADELQRFDKRINGLALAKLLQDLKPTHAVIERVHSMPKQGVASSFTFGQAYGTAIGVLNGAWIPLNFVTPQSWKRHFRLTGKTKLASVEKALDIFPEAQEFLKLKKHHGRADAILIARYFSDAIKRGDFV